MKYIALLLLFSLSVAAKPPLDRLGATVDAVLHTSVLQVVGEVKPVSIVFAPDIREFSTDKEAIPKSTEAIYKVFDEAIREKTLENPDLMVFYHPTLYPPDAKDKPIPHISFVNRAAMINLLKDRDAMLLLRAVGFEPPQTVDEMIELYQKAVKAGGYSINGPRDFSVVVGLALGYPPTEVYYYARDGKNSKRKGIDVPAEGFRLGGYVRLSEDATWYDEWYVSNSKKLTENYKDLKGEGKSGLDIWKSPKKLKANVDPAGRTVVELKVVEDQKKRGWDCGLFRMIFSQIFFKPIKAIK